MSNNLTPLRYGITIQKLDRKAKENKRSPERKKEEREKEKERGRKKCRLSIENFHRGLEGKIFKKGEQMEGDIDLHVQNLEVVGR